MNNITSAFLQSVRNRTDAFELIRKVLNTHFPFAIWRLPQTDTIKVLIDLTSDEQRYGKDLENVHQSFFINPYHQNHPIKPLVLSGDLLIKIEGNNAEWQISPTVPAHKLEAFEEVVQSGSEMFERKLNDGKEKHPDYEKMVADAVGRIQAGEMHKVVLSRYKDFDLPENFDALSMFEQLTNRYSNAFCYLTQTQTYGTWMGATPEKLIAVEQDRYFSTVALAGTQVIEEGQDLKEIAWRQKEIEEQAIVGRYIISCFKKIRLREYDEIGPRTAKAGNLAHLKSSFNVDMEATNSPMLGSTMLELLHPTSAVCGLPRDLANEFIRTHEDYDRELYAGFLGPVGFSGDSRLFVNLRCMQLFRHKARLYAGAGITEDSDPENELVETDNKMQTLLKVLLS